MNFTAAQKREIQAIIGQYGIAKRGLVTSWQPTPPMVKVQFMPLPPPEYGDPVESGWIPVLASATGLEGAGWRLSCPPQVGAQAFLQPEEGDGENYVVTGFYYSDVDTAPSTASNGEIVIADALGSQVYLQAGGKVTVEASAVLTLKAAGHTIQISNAGVVIDGIVFGTHQHTDVQPGGSLSGPPTA